MSALNLSSRAGKQALAYMDELYAATFGNPIGNGRLWPKLRDGFEVLIDVRPMLAAVHISEVGTLLNPRQGHGTRAMQFLIDLADKHQVPMTLCAKRIGTKGPTNAGLRRWYAKFGFKKVAGYDNYYMRREPRRPSNGGSK